MTETPEFSRPVPLETLVRQKTLRIEATDEERTHLAHRFQLEGLGSLSATLILTPAKKGREVHLTGRIEADIRQRCVVTLDPVESHISTDLDEWYSQDAMKEDEDEPPLTESGSFGDAPEPLEGDTLDVGEAVAQILSLEIDPFPRLADADLAAYGPDGRDGAETGESPSRAAFRELEKLKARMTGKPGPGRAEKE